MASALAYLLATGENRCVEQGSPAAGRGIELEDARWKTLEAVLPLVYVTEFEPEGRIRYISEIARDWTGHEPAEFLESPGLWYTCIHPGDVDRVRDAEERFFHNKEQLNLEYRLVGPDGESRWVWERNTIVRDGDGVPICAHGTIVDLSRFGPELLLDPLDGHAGLLLRQNFLTGLPTRPVLTEHLQLAIARAARANTAVALLDLDVDRFRAVNDSVGHSAGDVVLAQVARRLASCARPGDLLAHSGGDEFLLLLADLDHDTVERTVEDVAARIGEAMESPFDVAGEQLHLRTSIGYAISPDDAVGADALQRAAHIAVAETKAAVRGELRRYLPGNDGSLRRLSVDYRLRRAIERDEIVPYYQSIVDLTTGQVKAAEALVRWETPDGVLGAPAFVPAAEESSLIVDLDIHMIRSVCAQARAWRDQGRTLRAHVNVSSRLLAWHGFVRAVLQAIDEEGIETSDLVIELTETTAMVDETAGVSLTELANAGLTIAIDDFGAAYSSMARLRALPVSMVKLDRAMLLAATGGLPPTARRGPTSRTLEAGRTTLRGVLKIGTSLGVETVVEGIESAAVRDLVIGLGAMSAQGFFFDRPASAAEFERALDARSLDP